MLIWIPELLSRSVDASLAYCTRGSQWLISSRLDITRCQCFFKRTPSARLVSMRLDKFHPIQRREEASRIVARYTNSLRRLMEVRSATKTHIRGIRGATSDQIGRDRKVMTRVSGVH